MAIGAIHLAWLQRLARGDHFRDLHSVIDLGPQDVQVERPLLQHAVQGLLPPERAAPLLGAMFAGGKVRPDAQPSFYGLFGLGPYASIDNEDKRATYLKDLNAPVGDLPEYDVVTNFGTTEHVFNIGEAFRTIHNLTAPGGLSLHCVPAFGFINHGFYNIHPNVFVEMARANHYELVDFTYLDNAFVRNQVFGERGFDDFDFDALPIRLGDMENTQVFMTKVVDLFYRNLQAPETRKAITGLRPGSGGWFSKFPSSADHICFVFDLIFIALRRPRTRKDFEMPIQIATGVPPLSQGG